MFRLLTASILLISIGFTTACSYFRLPVLQGNIVDYEKAEQLELGMTPRQVEFLLGTPLIRDSFGSPRWDYVVYYRSPQAKVIQKNLSIYFENDVVSRIEGRDALLADWRKQKAAVKQAKELLETPHPGQLPANAGGISTAPQKAEQQPTATQQTQPQPIPQPEPRQTTGQGQQPAAEAQAQPPQSEPDQESTQPDYPPDMTTIYKK